MCRSRTEGLTEGGRCHHVVVIVVMAAMLEVMLQLPSGAFCLLRRKISLFSKKYVGGWRVEISKFMRTYLKNGPLLTSSEQHLLK